MERLHSEQDTIAAIATPPGAGAVGLVRLSGPGAIAVADLLLDGGATGRPSTWPVRSLVRAELGRSGSRLDRVLATVFRAPASYTGEDVVEISCHGGPQVMREALRLCLDAGARLAEAGEFSRRAFLNGKMDLAQAEAVADLIRAETDAGRRAALDQLEGGLSREVRAIRDDVVSVLSHLEVDLDHSDDATVGLTLPPKEAVRVLEQALARVKILLDSYAYGKLVKDGVRVAIVGKPNVGKSSLLNRLLGEDRAIVTPVPGTTRDTVEEMFDLFGIPARLVDTAGLRVESNDPVERIGMERSLKALERSDAVIAVLDASAPLSEDDRRLSQKLSASRALLVALNKGDLPPVVKRSDAERLFPGAPSVEVSALSNAGMENLLRALKNVAAPDSGAQVRSTVITSLRHRDALRKAAQALERASSIARETDMQECLAVELRETLDALGAIVGETVTEDILREIFSHFCIGK